MQPPDHLLTKGIASLPTIGDGRQSGTADSPSILNASPESAAGGGLAWIRTGDIIRIDLNQGRCDMLVEPEEIERRKADGIPAVPADATPWQRIYRNSVTQLSDGAVLEGAADFRQIATRTPPRHNHCSGRHGAATFRRQGLRKRSEERRVGKRVSVRVETGGRRYIINKNIPKQQRPSQ